MQIDTVFVLEVRACVLNKKNIFTSTFFFLFLRNKNVHIRLVGIENFNLFNFLGHFSLFLLVHLARGNISQNSSGVLVALLDQAQKLEPQSGSPVVILETPKK